MKLLLLLAAAIAAALYFPDSRAWVLDRAQPVVNPILRTATVSEMDKIVTDLQQYSRENFGRLPDTRQFQAWLEGQYNMGGSRDSWDTPYQLEDLRRNRRMQIRSWGPDRLRGTDDDILVAFVREGR
jgi:hypothetical protein